MTNVTQLPLSQIDRAAKEYDDARRNLDSTTRELNTEVEAMKRKYITVLKLKVSHAAEKCANLENLIATNPELFKQPKSMVLHGLQFGFRRNRERIETAEANDVIELIEAALPKKVASLIEIDKKLRKSALKSLTDEELAAIACERVPGADEVFVAAVDNEVDKFVNKLMSDAMKEAA